jgi:hypothetical protein
VKSYSLTMRQAMAGASTDEVPVILVTIRHPDLDAPVRLSSDPTERLSFEPLVYGTVSQREAYSYVLMAARVPDSRERAAPRTSLVFENVDADMVSVIRSVVTPATVDLALVLASQPDVIEARWTDLFVVAATYDAERVTLDISREPYTSEPWPAGRITPARFPGLFT